MVAYAGLDVGTSGTKMVVYDLKGNVLYKAEERYKEYGGDGYREIDGNEILDYVFRVLKNVGENCPVPVDAMAVTSLGESVVFLDKDKKSLCRSMVTGDKRGIPETERLTREMGAHRTVNQWRLQINAGYPLALLPEVGTNTAYRCPMRPA